MNKPRIIKWALLLVGIPFLAWILMGSLVGYNVSQREETRHDRYVKDYRDPQKEHLRKMVKKKDRAMLTWTHTPPEGTNYKVQLYPDRTYRVTIFLGTYTPSRIEPGKASRNAWATLEAALENPKSLVHANTPKRIRDTRVSIRSKRGGVSFNAADYRQLAPEVQALDEAVAGVIAEASLRPPRRYARVPDPVTFDVPHLVRGLESDRTKAYPHIIRHLAVIGKSALPELERILEASSAKTEVSRKRNKAVLDGLEAYPEVHARVLPKVREIASVHYQPGRRADDETIRAVKFTKDVLLRQYVQEAFAGYELDFTLPVTPPSEELREKYQQVIGKRRRGRADARALVQELEDLGPDVIPLLLESLEQRLSNKLQLMDALAIVGGPDAILYARKMEILDTPGCVIPLGKLGEEAIPALLFLLEIGSHYTSGISSIFAKDPETYRSAIPPIRDMLERRRGLYAEAKHQEVRILHRNAVSKLIGMLMALGATDPQSVQSLCDTAVDKTQHNSVRESSLKLLRRIGAPASGGTDALEQQAGYEAAYMRGRLMNTAKSLRSVE